MVSVFRHTLQKRVGGLAVSQNFIQIHFHNLRFQWKKKAKSDPAEKLEARYGHTLLKQL